MKYIESYFSCRNRVHGVPFFDFGHRIFIIFVRGENLNRTIFVEQELPVRVLANRLHRPQSCTYLYM